MNIGPGRQDATCEGNPFSLPHILLGTSPKVSERIFSSGNERTKAWLPAWEVNNAGYKLNSADKFSLIVDLMNENPEPVVVYLTIMYDFIAGHPENFDHIRPVWLDIAQCLTSEYPAPKQTGRFTVSAPPWRSTFDGEILGLAGHAHDGGQAVAVFVEGQLVCNSTATYGGSPEYQSKHPMAHGSAVEHISAMKVCAGANVGVKDLKKGMTINLKATYDYDMNKGDLHGDGKQANVMGIAIVFVREKNTSKRSEYPTVRPEPQIIQSESEPVEEAEEEE
jgi:hypothetical protein